MIITKDGSTTHIDGDSYAESPFNLRSGRHGMHPVFRMQ